MACFQDQGLNRFQKIWEEGGGQSEREPERNKSACVLFPLSHSGSRPHRHLNRLGVLRAEMTCASSWWGPGGID